MKARARKEMTAAEEILLAALNAKDMPLDYRRALQHLLIGGVELLDEAKDVDQLVLRFHWIVKFAAYSIGFGARKYIDTEDFLSLRNAVESDFAHELETVFTTVLADRIGKKAI